MSVRNKGINTFHHVVMRGSRDMEIVRNDKDRYDFLKLLYYLNDEYQNLQWERDIKNSKLDMFERPKHWPKRKPLVGVSAFCLHDNHFHLLLKEIKEGGISKFMQRLPNSMTRRFNVNYGGKGSIFQSSHKACLVDGDLDLRNVALYIMAKNVMERYPKDGLKNAVKNFESAWKWASGDIFSSFPDFATDRNSPIVEKDLLADYFKTPAVFKKEAKNYLENWQEKEEKLGDLKME